MSSPTSAGPTEDGPGDDCARVRRLLARAGFETVPQDGNGLRVWAAPEGVLIGWVAQEVLRPTIRIHGHEEDLSRLTALAGLHTALRTALAVTLRNGGLDVAVRGDHLLALRPRDATGAGPDPEPEPEPAV
ncbi:hypothetical protein ACFQ78_09530 [Streptomyces sp. NPDC056519]|uniref:hypothetical protein n=1 Tax=Streptomyces sp. NPDC056519 TaxID=3345849 RepID=UPI0036ACD309